jgi:hypothetical protein
MILISHRGNIDGKNLEQENSPKYIDNAISLGYDVEVDIWLIGRELYLGHDKPLYKVEFLWLKDRINKLWIHCKNPEAVNFFRISDYDFNYFWHENDTLTLTSKKHIWVYPGKQPIDDSIAVLPEINNDDTSKCLGVCSDIIKTFKYL